MAACSVQPLAAYWPGWPKLWALPKKVVAGAMQQLKPPPNYTPFTWSAFPPPPRQQPAGKVPASTKREFVKFEMRVPIAPRKRLSM